VETNVTAPEIIEERALTIASVAHAYGISPETIHRHHESGRFPNAFTDDKGLLRIPEEDLEAAGFERWHAQTATNGEGRDTGDPGDTMELEQLRLEVAVLRERVTAAEALSKERLERIEDMRLVLTVLKPLTESIGPEALTGGSALVLPGTGDATSVGARAGIITPGSHSGSYQYPPPPPPEATFRPEASVSPRWEEDPDSLPLIWLPGDSDTNSDPLLVEATATKQAGAAGASDVAAPHPLPEWIDQTGQEPSWYRGGKPDWMERRGGLHHRRRLRRAWLRLTGKRH